MAGAIARTEWTVDVDEGLGCSSVSWCPATSLLAIGARRRPRAACAELMLLEPRDPTRAARLTAPLAGTTDELLRVQWSPLGCRRLLLAASRGGRLTVWGQVPPNPAAPPRAATTFEWWAERVDLQGTAGAPLLEAGNLVAAEWLGPSPAAVWDSGRIGAADFDRESLDLQTLLQRPADSQPSSSGFEWVRPGRLAVALVAESGAMVLAWASAGGDADLGWASTSPLALPGTAAAAGTGAAGGPSITAAAVAARGTSVLVAYVVSTEPGEVRLAAIDGDPSFALAAAGGADAAPGAAVQLPVRAMGVLPGAATGGGTVTALAWSPAGDRLCIESAVAGGSGVIHLAEDTGGGSWGLGAAQPVPGCSSSSSSDGGSSGPVWCPTGGAVLHPSGGVFDVGASGPTLHRQRCTFPSSPVLVAPSPNGAAACGVVRQATGGTQLVVWTLPEQPASGGSGANANLLAARLAWPLLLGSSTWDAVQSLLSACGFGAAAAAACSNNSSSGGGGQGDLQALSHVLSLVDGLVHRVPSYQLPHHSALYDAAKLAVVGALPGPLAESLAVDLRLRLVFSQLVFSAASCAADLVQELKQNLQDKRDSSEVAGRVSASDVTAAQATAQVVTDAVLLVLTAVKAWLEALRAAEGAGGGPQSVGREDVDALPLIRLLPDFYSQRILNHATRSFTSLLAVADKLASKQQQDGGSASQQPRRGSLPPAMVWRDGISLQDAQAALLATVNALYVIPSGDKSLPSQEHLAATQRLQGGGCGSFHGPLHLHYSRVTIREPRPLWEACDAVRSDVPLMAKLPLVDRTELMRRAARLSLTPPAPRDAEGTYMREAAWRAKFRSSELAGPHTAAADADPTAAACEGSGSAKRRRWALDALAAMGSPLALAVVRSDAAATDSREAAIDLLTFMPAGQGPSGAGDGSSLATRLTSVDGAMVTGHLSSMQAGPSRTGALAQQQQQAWAWANPLTGTGWTLAAS